MSLGDDITSLFMAAGLAIYSIGLFLIGIWLKSEEVVDEPELTATA